MLSFTLSVGCIFVVAYLSSTFVSEENQLILKLYTLSNGIPSTNGFMLLWGIVYLCSGALLTVTISNRCLRRATKIWGLLGALNLLFTLTYFKLGYHYFGLALIIYALIMIAILLNFYLKNTRFIWFLLIPILSIYLYSLFLAGVCISN